MGGTISKGVGLCIIFWTQLHFKSVECIDWAVAAFTVGQTLISVLLLVLKAWPMSGFESWFQHSQCWGMILSTAPYAQNIVLCHYKFVQAIRLADATTVAGMYSTAVLKMDVFRRM